MALKALALTGLLTLLTTAQALAAEVVYSCAGGTQMIAIFSPPSDAPGNVELVIAGSDAKLTLPQVKSANGGRYVSGEVEFWITGKDATFTRAGQIERCRSN